MGLGNVATPAGTAQLSSSEEPSSELALVGFEQLALRAERDGIESLSLEEREQYGAALEGLRRPLQRAAARCVAPMAGRLARTARRELGARYTRRRPAAAPPALARTASRARPRERRATGGRMRARSPGSSEPEPPPLTVTSLTEFRAELERAGLGGGW